MLAWVLQGPSSWNRPNSGNGLYLGKLRPISQRHFKGPPQGGAGEEDKFSATSADIVGGWGIDRSCAMFLADLKEGLTKNGRAVGCQGLVVNSGRLLMHPAAACGRCGRRACARRGWLI